MSTRFDYILGQLRLQDDARRVVLVAGSPFASTTARDTWSTTNFAQLQNSNTVVSAAIVNDGTTVTSYRWAGDDAPSSAPANIGNLWDIQTTLSADDRNLLDALDAISDNTIPLKGTSGYIDSSLTESIDRVNSSKIIKADSFEANTGSVLLDDNTKVAANNESLDLTIGIDERREVITSGYDDSGSSLPQYSEKAALIINPLQTVSDTTNADFNFTRTVSLKSHFRGFTVNPAATGNGTFQIRANNSTGTVLVTATTINFTQANQSSSFDLTNPVKVDTGDVLWVSYTGVALNGSVLSGVDGFSDGFVPILSTSIHLETDKPLATQEYVQSQMSGITDNNNFVNSSSLAVDANSNIELTLGRLNLGDLTTSFRLIAGANIQLLPNTTNNTITIISSGGGGTTPTPISIDLRYGLSQQSDPALVDFSTLTDVASPTNPQTVSTGTTTAGDYFHIFSPNTHIISTIRDTVLDQIVYEDGGTGNIYTKTTNSRIENSITYDAYSIGPLNAGVDESYVLTFTTT